jgi:hypothetical protein
MVEKELDIRKRILKDYNKKEEGKIRKCIFVSNALCFDYNSETEEARDF